MSESFEARLTAASSKETFKKAKHLLKNGELLCCMESEPGVLRAVCRDADGHVSRTEFRGFPKGPFSGTCDCSCADGPGFCRHAMAAALYHAKYTIKYKEPDEIRDAPAQYAGLKFAGIPELLTQVLQPADAFVEIEAQTEFPHVPSKWERVPLDVKLKTGRREYFGNLNNLRQLQFGKSLAASLFLSSFPAQDRQIIRYLAINAQQDGTNLTLDAEQCAEFFHCLPGFRRFTRLGESVVVHREPATPLLLLEKVKGGYILKSAVAVKGSPLPLNDVKVITGRTGCWIGMLGEYWWIPAQMDVSWLRNFLRTTIQPCDAKAAQLLLDSRETLPVRLIAASGIKVRQRKFKTLYDGRLTSGGALEMEILFDYDGRLCKADQLRLAASQGGNFWRRNTKEEFETIQELVNFGFQPTDPANTKDGVTHLVLKEREAIGMFVDELIPKWLRENRDCLLSSNLAALAGNSASVTLRCRVLEKTSDRWIVSFELAAAGIPLRWKALADAAAKNEFFMPAGTENAPVKIPAPVRKLASIFGAVARIEAQRTEIPDADILSIPLAAAITWASAGADIPGAVPLEFLRIKVDMDQLLENRSGEPEPLAVDEFRGELRNYQAAGVRWIDAMFQRGCGVILADEMGLGKTIQTLALLTVDRKRTLPAMLICPTSLVANWQREAEHFTPSLRTIVIEGHDRKSLWEKAPSSDFIICSYALMKRDMEFIEPLCFSTLILDEAQHIKNPASANSQSCKMVRAEHKLVLTGTPLENSAEDLWSIFDFLLPGFLGPLHSFRAKYAELSSSPEQKKELSERIGPFLLRRKKIDVCRELPPKQEQTLFCEMTNGQRALYDGLEKDAAERCERLKSGGHDVSGMDILAALMRLRQTCCDPALLPEDILRGRVTGNEAPPSAKMELLQEVLLESIDSGHKVLVFSQFTSLLKIIREWLDTEAIRYEYLDGSTKDRIERVDSFNSSPDIPLFLLSLKAGGLGLNLTSADTVIICDPWWNPAAEDQAADRTHRIGQTKNVNCIKLVVKDSIEERVLELQQKKKDLFNSLVEDAGSSMGSLTLEDFEFLLKRP